MASIKANLQQSIRKTFSNKRQKNEDKVLKNRECSIKEGRDTEKDSSLVSSSFRVNFNWEGGGKRRKNLEGGEEEKGAMKKGVAER